MNLAVLRHITKKLTALIRYTTNELMKLAIRYLLSSATTSLKQVKNKDLNLSVPLTIS